MHFRSAAARDLSAKDIAHGAEAQDPEALEAIAIYEDRLARGLAHVINILDPDTIVLGGGLSNIRRLYQALPGLIRQYVFSDSFETAIVPAAFGDSSGVRGAALLWPSDTT
jgi:fructokinase